MKSHIRCSVFTIINDQCWIQFLYWNEEQNMVPGVKDVKWVSFGFGKTVAIAEKFGNGVDETTGAPEADRECRQQLAHVSAAVSAVHRGNGAGRQTGLKKGSYKQRRAFTRLLIFKIKFSSEPPSRWLAGSAEMTPVIGNARRVRGEVMLTIELVD